MSNSTSSGPKILTPLREELSSVDYQWVALESLSDILCVLMALYVVMHGIKKLWPYHQGYAGAKKGFVWLASRWGIGRYPHLFRTVVGLTEIFIFIGCLMCFIPGPTSQLITCTALITSIAICVCFFVTHSADPWSESLIPLRHLVYAAVALWIRLYQDVDTHDPLARYVLIGWSACTSVGVCYMLYRRARYGKVPDPLLG